MQQPVVERARAKINLTLRVLGRRPDGYHLLESLIVFADVGDDVHFTPGTVSEVVMSGQYAGAISGPNLIDRTLDRLAIADPALVLGRVEVEKKLPIAAGIGGGSADAAAVLRAIRTANQIGRHLARPLGREVDWSGIAAALGADVPVCLADRSAFVWGVGEHIEPAPNLPGLHAVLVCPLANAPLEKTRSVFRQLSLPQISISTVPEALPPFANAGALIDYMRAVGNHLRAPSHAVLPSSAVAEAALALLPDCLYVGLSGAGPTSYGIFADAARADAAARDLSAEHPDWWIVSTTLGD